MQLDIYQNYNLMLRSLHSEAFNARVAETDKRMAEEIHEKTQQLNHREGESISMDDYEEIYCEVKAEERVANNFSLNTRDKKGDITDFLEARRPFGAAA